jgi:hypothetical protein
MAFGDKLWASTATSLTIDLESSAVHLVTQSHASDGGGSHLLSLLGVTELSIRATLPKESIYPEIREFGAHMTADGELEVTINVSDATELRVRCADAVFDGNRYAT